MKREKYVAYVGTYTNEGGKGIHVFDLDVKNGKLQEMGVAKINNPSDVIVSHNGKILYSIADEGVSSFKILPDGALEFLNQQSIGGMRGCSLTLDEKDRYLFVAGYHDGRVTMMRLNKDGSIAGIADGIFHKGLGTGIAERCSQPHVTCVRLTPEQKYLCAVDNGLNHIKIYEIDYEKGKLKLSDILRFQLEAAPKSIRFGKEGSFAYALCENKDCINVYSYKNEKFELLETVSTVYESDPEGCIPVGMELSADGEHLFCSNAGSNTVAIYNVDSETGLLTQICHSKISGDYPKNLAVMPDGKHFLSLNHAAGEIVTFKVDYEKQYFLLHGKPLEINKPNCMYVHRLQ